MIFSTLKEYNKPKDTVMTFGGYNNNIQIADGEFFDMKNLSSTNYPTLSPRALRSTYVDSPCTGIVAKDRLCYVSGTDLHLGDTVVSGLPLNDVPKQMVSMGAYIIIMPDKVYVNTNDISDYGTLDNEVITASTVTYSMCNVSGEEYNVTTIQNDPPENPKNNDLWINTSTTPNELMQWSELQLMWVSIATSYVKIACKDIAKGFKAMDAVKISGIDTSLTQLKDLEGQTSIIWDIHRDEVNNGDDDYIVVIGMINEVASQSNALTVERTVPNMDFVIESGNRLWGCRYGTDKNGNNVNEIYASKLGDFCNFNYFSGTSADSYAVTCGTDGAFTGAISYLGYPLFFKENCLHKVFGTMPSNYQVKSTECKGVMRGASKSLVLCNDYLIYKSRGAVCMYDGSLPSEISSQFGKVQYNLDGAVAGFVQNKYYISMKSEEDNEWHLLVYDLSKGMWHKEDNLRVDSFCAYNGELYFIDASSKKIRTILGTVGTVDEESIEWMAETNVLGLTKHQGRYTVAFPGKKYIAQMLCRITMEAGSSVEFSLQYDSSEEWEVVAVVFANKLKAFFLPIRPRRCDHFKLKIEGVGKAMIYSITKAIEEGSDF